MWFQRNVVNLSNIYGQWVGSLYDWIVECKRVGSFGDCEEWMIYFKVLESE